MAKDETTNAAQTTGTPPPAKAAPADVNAALLARLESMEALLAQQAENTRKTARSRRTTTLLMVLLVAVMAAGLWWINTTVETITKDVPVLIETTTRSVEQLETTLADISKIDFDGMNTAIGEIGDGVGAMDFEALNNSIVELNQVVEALSRVMSVFR